MDPGSLRLVDTIHTKGSTMLTPPRHSTASTSACRSRSRCLFLAWCEGAIAQTVPRQRKIRLKTLKIPWFHATRCVIPVAESDSALWSRYHW